MASACVSDGIVAINSSHKFSLGGLAQGGGSGLAGGLHPSRSVGERYGPLRGPLDVPLASSTNPSLHSSAPIMAMSSKADTANGGGGMFASPFAAGPKFGGGLDQGPPLGVLPSDLSSCSDVSTHAALPRSPSTGGGAGGASYSPFMGVPWGSSMTGYLGGEQGGPGGGYAGGGDAPGSPMSPGIIFNPAPSPNGATGGLLGAPGSPRATLFNGGSTHSSPSPFGLAAANSTTNATGNGLRGAATGSLPMPSPGSASNGGMMADAAAAAAAALNAHLPSFYFQAAAAAAAGGTGSLSLQAALSSGLVGSHAAANLAAAAQQQQQQAAAAAAAAAVQQQLLQASLSAAFSASNPYLGSPYPSAVLSALEPMRSAGGSLSLDGGLQQQASMTAALLQQQQQQQHAAAAAQQLRRNLSTPAAVAAAAHYGLGGTGTAGSLGLAAGGSHHGAPGLTAAGAGSALSPLAAAHIGRLHVTHSADLTHLDAAALFGGPNSSGALSTQMAAAAAAAARSKGGFKARKNSEPKIGPDGQPRLNARQRRTLRRAKERALKGLLEVSQALLHKAEVQVTVPNISHLTALEELAAVEAEKEAAAIASGAHTDDGRGGPGGAAGGGSRPGGATRSQQLAAAAAAVEESVCEIARAAVAAVTAQAAGRDTSSAAAAAQAAAAQAASAAASAGAVLPPDYCLLSSADSGTVAVVVPPRGDSGADEQHSGELTSCDGAGETLSHSAPTSPVGSSIPPNDSSSGRSSTSSSGGGGSGRSSGSGSVASSFCGQAKPPLQPRGISASAGCSPLPSPSGGGGMTAAATKGGAVARQLEGIDIAGLIGQLSLKKDEGVVDDKLIRDLQIIQSLIGALKAPGGLPPPALEGAASMPLSIGAAAAATMSSPASGGATSPLPSSRQAGVARNVLKRAT